MVVGICVTVVVSTGKEVVDNVVDIGGVAVVVVDVGGVTVVVVDIGGVTVVEVVSNIEGNCKMF